MILYFQGSLTAPSPTVNTREAMQVVMGMFNQTLDIDKQFPWSGQDMDHSDNDLEAQFAAPADSMYK